MSPRDKEAKDQEKAAQQAGDEAAQEVKDRTGVGDRPPSDPQELRREIEETREELGATVEALAEKADVKAQAQQKVDEKKAQAQQKVDETKERLREAPDQAKAKLGEVGQQVQDRPVPVAAVAGGVAAALLVVWLIRRR